MSFIEAIKSAARPAALATILLTAAPAAHGQQPSAAAIATARELITTRARPRHSLL